MTLLPQQDQGLRFDQIYSLLSLHRAVLQVYTKPLFVWRKALSQSHDARTLYDFARHSGRNIERLHKALSRKRFEFRAAVPLPYNANGKKRVIYVFPWEERIVDRLLYNQLNWRCNHLFSQSSYAYRQRGLGLDSAQRRIAQLTRPGGKLYIVKRDIRDYFPSINHELLLQMLKRWVAPDDYLYELIRQRIEFQIREGSETTVATAGIPFGSAIACFLANVYLTQLDRVIDDIDEITYVRYADDILLASCSRTAMLQASQALDAAIGDLKLESKPSHHLNLVFHSDPDPTFENASHFRHLGLEFTANGRVRLSRDKARKIRNLFRFAFRKAKRKFRRCRSPASRAALAITIAREVTEDGFRPIAIINYYLKHVDDDEQLRLLDRWLAEEVLALAYQNGHRKGNFRHMPFSKLREMGLPSLRHRQQLLRHGHLQSSFFQLRTERIMKRERNRLPGRKAFSPNLEAAAKNCS
jgi:hypothetical protein